MKKNSKTQTAKGKTPAISQAEPAGNPQLMKNFTTVMDAIKDNQLACIVGVAITRNGDMLDLFGTAGNQMFESTALVQVENLRDNMRGLQNRRMAQIQHAQKQAATDQQAQFPPATKATKTTRKAPASKA